MTAIGSGVKGLIAKAQREAQRRGQTPATAHLLLVMLQTGGTVGRLLGSLSVRESDLLNAIRVVDPEPSSALERAMESAYRLAKSMSVPEVTPAHLLFAVARDGRSTAHRSLEKLGASPARVQQSVIEALGWSDTGTSRYTKFQSSASPKLARPSARRTPTITLKTEPKPKIESAEPPAARMDDLPKAPVAKIKSSPQIVPMAADLPKMVLDASRFPVLHSLGRNLTELARAGRIDPVIGRDDEIEQLLDVLARRRSNNPILVGPPGVGKTAIVEGLVQRLASGGQGVCELQDKVVFEISPGGLISGTGVRGALSERLAMLRQEVQASDGRVILFIDETHALFTGGDSPDDLAHELKASLARGELPCIGATTDNEYKKYILRDPALARRFSAIHVQEPSPEDAVEIIDGIVPRYEVHHNVEYSREAIEAAVELSVRYVPNKSLPDKAIGVLDLAGSRVSRKGLEMVDRIAVATVVAEQVRVPVERLLQNDIERLVHFEEALHERVVGHEDSMRTIGDALRKGAAGFHGNRPLATFLFLGPTGVGKTETAKAINEMFFPGCAMTRLDMSEFSEAHAVARLLGAPPGYVGHDDGGQLTEAVRHRPYQMVLLDEIEKAHIDVLQALLPMLDEGRLTDAKGRCVDFKNTIVVMTSNLGAHAVGKSDSRIGFGGVDESVINGAPVLAAARKALPPEIWNRIDEPLYFGPLSKPEVRMIASRLLQSVAAQLAERQEIDLCIDPTAIDVLVEAGGFDAALGARPMRRTIGRLVEAKIANAILQGQIGKGASIELAGHQGEIVLQMIDDSDSIEAAE